MVTGGLMSSAIDLGEITLPEYFGEPEHIIIDLFAEWCAGLPVAAQHLYPNFIIFNIILLHFRKENSSAGQL